MAIDIKTRMILEGEKKYTQAMENAAKSVKEMNSRLNVAKTEFAKTGDQEKYVAAQTEILKEKIAEQEKAVKAAEEALKFLAENGLEETDEKMRKWSISLNNAQANLNRLEKELSDVGDSLDNSNKKIKDQDKAFENAEDSADDYRKTLEHIDKNISFQTTLSKLQTVYNSVSGILRGIVNVGKEIWGFESQSAQWADEINTAASQAGVDAATYQSWRYASRFIDVTVEDLVSMQKKITEVMTNGSEESMMLFNQLGVPTREADGTARNAYDVMLDVATALGEIANETTRAKVASGLLGEEYNKLYPLVDAGVGKWNAYVTEAEKVATVSEESLQALQELDDARQRFNAIAETTKTEIAGQLAPGFTAITDGLSSMLTTFSDFLETEKGRELVERINELMSTLGEKLADADLGIMMDKLVGGLEWIVNNGDTIIKTLGGIAGVFGTIKIAQSVLTFMALSKTLTGGGKAASAVTASVKGAFMPFDVMEDFYEYKAIKELPPEVTQRTIEIKEKLAVAETIIDGTYAAAGGGGKTNGSGAGRGNAPLEITGTIDMDAALKIVEDGIEEIDHAAIAGLSDVIIEAFTTGEEYAAAIAAGIDARLYLVMQAKQRVENILNMNVPGITAMGGIFTGAVIMSGQQVGEITAPVVNGYIGTEIEGR